MVVIDSVRGRVTLAVAQCAAMMALAGMPLWVGNLMGGHHFDARQAGLIVSLYVAAAVIGGLSIAPLFHRLRSGRMIAAGGLALAALVFFHMSRVDNFVHLAVLHMLGGLFVGPVLAVVEGTIGRSEQPHRLFSITAVSLSLASAAFLAVIPAAVAKFGGAFFFQALSGILAVGGAVCALGFPSAGPSTGDPEPAQRSGLVGVPRSAWAGIIGLFCMSVVYAMTMAFVERVGVTRGYGAGLITIVLAAMAFIRLVVAAAAGLLEHRFAPRAVLLAMPPVQALCSAAVFLLPAPAAYVASAWLFTGTLIFAHVFGFGLIARLDPSGRAIALSPSVMLAGSACGPLLGGMLVQGVGYPALAIAGPCIGAIALFAFLQVRDGVSPVAHATPAARPAGVE